MDGLKPYSLDLRKRVVAAVLTGGMSRNEEATQQFGVSIKHGNQLGEAPARDRQRCTGPDGRSQTEGDFGRAPAVGVAADRGWGLSRYAAYVAELA